MMKLFVLALALSIKADLVLYHDFTQGPSSSCTRGSCTVTLHGTPLPEIVQGTGLIVENEWAFNRPIKRQRAELSDYEWPTGATEVEATVWFRYLQLKI